MSTSVHQHIFLIGMPGSGKTTLGKQLAERLQIEFVDLDTAIEELEGKSVFEIFKQKGESDFRVLESRLLREWAGSKKNFVMATGGGAPCFHKGIEVINANGVSIFLDCPVPLLVERVSKHTTRPLLLARDQEDLTARIKRIRETRLTCYRQANHVLEDPTLQDILDIVQVRR